MIAFFSIIIITLIVLAFPVGLLLWLIHVEKKEGDTIGSGEREMML